MGERVWFATIQDSDPQAASGFTGFPFHIPPVTQAEIDSNPSLYRPLNHAFAVELVWRVKKMRLVVDVEVEHTMQDHDNNTTLHVSRHIHGEIVYPWGGYNITRYVETADFPTSESEIMTCSENEIYRYGGYSALSWEALPPPAGITPQHVSGRIYETFTDHIHDYSVTVETAKSGYFRVAGKKGNNFFGYYDASRIAALIGLAESENQIPAGNYRVWPSHPTGGLAAPFYVYQFPGTVATVRSAQIDLIPAEFWTYANSQGAPVWDPQTGAQLVDPVS